MKPHFLTRAAMGAAASVAVLLPLAGCSNGTGGNTSDTQLPSTDPSTTPRSSSPPVTTSPGGYRDGTYTERGVYGGAPSYMTITLTLRAGSITAVTVEPMPENNDTSRGYQERFAAATPSEVVGKPIDGLSVGKIAGASGCADGFNDALAKIRRQATISN